MVNNLDARITQRHASGKVGHMNRKRVKKSALGRVIGGPSGVLEDSWAMSLRYAASDHSRSLSPASKMRIQTGYCLALLSDHNYVLRDFNLAGDISESCNLLLT